MIFVIIITKYVSKITEKFGQMIQINKTVKENLLNKSINMGKVAELVLVLSVLDIYLMVDTWFGLLFWLMDSEFGLFCG